MIEIILGILLLLIYIIPFKGVIRITEKQQRLHKELSSFLENIDIVNDELIGDGESNLIATTDTEKFDTFSGIKDGINSKSNTITSSSSDEDLKINISDLM